MLRNPPKQIWSNLHVLIFDLLCLMVGFTMVSKPKSPKTIHPSDSICFGTTMEPLNTTDLFFPRRFHTHHPPDLLNHRRRFWRKPDWKVGFFRASLVDILVNVNNNNRYVFCLLYFLKMIKQYGSWRNQYIKTSPWSDLTNQRDIFNGNWRWKWTLQVKKFLRLQVPQWKSGFLHQIHLALELLPQCTFAEAFGFSFMLSPKKQIQKIGR